VLSAGFKSGLGIEKKGGKFSWEGLLGQIAGSYLQKFLPQVTGGQTEPIKERSLYP
jgi:hypothetical protein